MFYIIYGTILMDFKFPAHFTHRIDGSLVKPVLQSPTSTCTLVVLSPEKLSQSRYSTAQLLNKKHVADSGASMFMC